MSRKIDQSETLSADSAGGLRSEPEGRAERPAGGAPAPELWQEVQERLSDEVIDELLAGARSEEEIVGAGGGVARVAKRVVERAVQAGPDGEFGREAHPGRPG